MMDGELSYDKCISNTQPILCSLRIAWYNLFIMNPSYKVSTIIIALLSIFLLSCSSDTEAPNLGDSSLVGKWQLTERAYSIGAGLIVEEVSRGEIYEIRSDGTFTYDSGGRASGTWDVSADDILNFSFKEEVEDRIVNFKYEFDGDALIFRPAFVICTDGCYDKYERR